jgi:hypothetical protein
MDDRIEGLFSGAEIKLRKELFSLMQDWEKTVSSEKEKAPFMYDGFLPGYYETSPKALFIGRESRNQEESRDYVANTIEFFKQGTIVNSAPYWKRILCMYHIIRNNGIIDETITADRIAQEMIEKNNYGFAVMNISKYLNDSENSEIHDPVLMNNFFEDSKLGQRNFLEEEIALLDPDLILTANLWGCGISENLEKHLGKLTFLNEKVTVQSDWAAALNSIEIKNKTVKLIDFYHFSSRKGDMDYYYKPLSILLKSIL